MKDCSIDLETLALTPDAHILSIGAVEFDLDTGEVGESFYSIPGFVVQFGRSISPEVVQWWLGQPNEVSGEFSRGGVELKTVLERFKGWWLEHGKPCLWGNGAAFDITILEDAYRWGSAKVPWSYQAVRDTRTLVDLCRRYTKQNPTKMVHRTGEHHNALHDARWQAKLMIKAWKLIREEIGGAIELLADASVVSGDKSLAEKVRENEKALDEWFQLRGWH